MPRSPCLLLVVAVAVSVPLAAQHPVFTVGGAGANYATLPAAVAGAPPGALLLVRSGVYTGFTTSKPLVILLEFAFGSSAIVNAPAGAPYAIRIDGLPAGSEFVLAGRASNVGAGSAGAIAVANCAGRVVIEGVNAAAAATAVTVTNSAAVVVQQCLLQGAPALAVADGALALAGGQCTATAGPAVVSLRAALELTHGGYVGAAAPAFDCTDSDLRLLGQGATLVRSNGASGQPQAAVRTRNGSLQWEPSALLLSSASGGPALDAIGTSVAAVDLPRAIATGAGPGGTATVALVRLQPAPGLLVIGFLGVPMTFGGIGGVWLDLAAPVAVIAVGVVDAQGLALQVPVPNNPALRGESFGLQGVVVDGAAMLRSNPAVWNLL